MGKRIFDVVVGAVMSLVALPFILGFAIALAITLRAWPFFMQERIGQHGRSFKMLKLRTLPPSTPAYASKHVLDMDRLPALCQFLRGTHLDELPQLFCVVAGRLSLVGPRPKMPHHAESIDEDFGEIRVTVPQGCTGLWQISEHAHLEVSAVADYDLFYVANRSLVLDVWILWRTALQTAGLAKPVSLSLAAQKVGAGTVQPLDLLIPEMAERTLRQPVAAAA